MQRNTANIENCFSRQQRHPLQQIEQPYSASMQSDPTWKAWQQRVIPSQPETFSNISGFVPAHHVPPVSGYQRQSTTACSNSLLIPWPESTQVTVTAGNAPDQERAGLQTVQHQPSHGNRSTLTAISNLTNESNNSHAAINSHARVLEHQNRTLTSSNGGFSGTVDQSSGESHVTSAVETNPEPSTRLQQQSLRNPFHPVMMTGAPPVGAVSGEAQDRQFVELANSQTVYKAPRLAIGPPLYQTAMLPPIKRPVASSKLPHRPGSEHYAMTFGASLNQWARSQNLSGSQALRIPSGSHFAAFENHKNNVFSSQEATLMPLRSGPKEFGRHLYGNENSNILEAWLEQDNEPGVIMTSAPPVGAVSGGPRNCQFVEMARSQTVHEAPRLAMSPPQYQTAMQPPIQAGYQEPLHTGRTVSEREPGSIAVRVPFEAATAPHNSIGIVKFGNTQQRVENSLTPRMGDCETPDEIRNFARAFKKWRLTLGLSRPEVSRLLKGANGKTYSKASICRFENSGLSLEFASEMKLPLQEFMASYKPVPDSGLRRRKRTSFSPEATELLEQFFRMNRYPTQSEVTKLAGDLAFDRKIIKTWFNDRRRRRRSRICANHQESLKASSVTSSSL